jgi:glycosyltransferase involved in cell wall biosynthesis/SAM-dependent methyltransferase
MSRDVVLLIPAYRPAEVLPELISELLNTDQDGAIHSILVVDDGSGQEFAPIFAELASLPRVMLLRHAVNLGKGAALKTGFNHFLLAFPDAAGVVTADADGQHAVEDILNVARELSEHPDDLILGVRAFAGEVPLRSRVGNALTRRIFQLFTGANIVDTQTGLRGWPRALCAESLPIAINGYDFELECLMRAHHGRNGSISVRQAPIKTIYLNNNQASHFNPIRDSMRIYFVFLRYCGASLIAAIVDSLIFSLVLRSTGDVVVSQIAGRAVALAIAFVIARNLVFHSDTSVVKGFLKYVTLVAVMGFVSYSMLSYLHRTTGMPLLACKLMAEGLLFLANFSIQRQLVFVRSKLENEGDPTGNLPLAHPSLKQFPMGSAQWFQAQRELIESKPLIKRCYDLWYRLLMRDADSVPETRGAGKVVELGSGLSYIKQIRPEVITSDVTPGLADMVIDGRELPFPDASVKALLLTHVFHHIPDVARFFGEASRVLVPGGVISIVDIPHTPFARFFFSTFHPEPYNDKAAEWSFPEGHSMLDSNQALSWIVFFRDKQKFRHDFPALQVERTSYLPWLSYLLSGGVNLRSFVPRPLAPLFVALDTMLKPLDALFAVHWHITVRKSNG